MNLSARDILPSDPYRLFMKWLDEAVACDPILYARAMCLSTVSVDGAPEGRIVMLHDVNPSGFAFFTDRRSKTGQALARHPRAALIFYWGPLERQVRVQGTAEVASKREADAFFAERPRRSKGTAWASTQSEPVACRADLEAALEAADTRFAEKDEIPRPPSWQAYRLVPHTIEFWQARSRRLHDRIEYRPKGNEWTTRRLAP